MSEPTEKERRRQVAREMGTEVREMPDGFVAVRVAGCAFPVCGCDGPERCKGRRWRVYTAEAWGAEAAGQ